MIFKRNATPVKISLLFFLSLACTLPHGVANADSNPALIPEGPRKILRDYCSDCHSQSNQEADINLDVEEISWTDKERTELWEKVLFNNQHGLMPPQDHDQPSPEERKVLSAWLDSQLTTHIKVGGTPPRRLNQAEYLKTLRELLYMHDYELPPGFPGDSEANGFDNSGEGLVMSASHMASYLKVASEVADMLYPQQSSVPSKLQKGGVDDLVLSFSASAVRTKLRLHQGGTSEVHLAPAAWAKMSGVYRITVEGSVFKPRDGDLPCADHARQVSASERSVISASVPEGSGFLVTIGTITDLRSRAL